ncbi:MAG TPA: hypothetical protein VJ327_09915, partial [Patescibacteria group bacterium]|nr:hypothetical protein [Patescibacteria group bacterium]
YSLVQLDHTGTHFHFLLSEISTNSNMALTAITPGNLAALFTIQPAHNNPPSPSGWIISHCSSGNVISSGKS